MKKTRPNVFDQRVEAILDQYRDKDARYGAERQYFLRIWRMFVYPLRWRLLVAVILSMIMNLQPYVWATFLQFVVDKVLMVETGIPQADVPMHLRWVIYMFFVMVGIHLSAILCSWQFNYKITLIGQKVVFELRKALHEKLQRLPLSFFDRTQTGRLLSVVLDDVSTVQGSIGGLAINLLNNIMLVFIGGSILVYTNWKLAIIVFIALPFYVLNFRHFRPRIREGNIVSRRANTALYNKVEERITAIRTIKVFGRERGESHAFATSADNMARLTMRIAWLGSLQNVVANAISPPVIGIVLYLAALACQHGDMTLGQVLKFNAIVTFIFPPAVAVNDLIGMDIPRVSVVLRRVLELLDSKPEPPDRENALALTDAKGDITFDDVTFTYPGDQAPSLHNLTFTIPAGKQVAIMGPSGAGKSTLLYLLMRFYDPNQGSISLDGHDLRDLQLLSLRDRVTLVMQEPVIFSGSVAENIRYGRLDASEAEVRRSARDSDLHEFIQTLPDGYETIVGERGMSLSGGQRQRLALAASLLSRPSVLLLDDTTSALDPVTEARVRQTLNRLMQGRTCFVVTHRVSTALASDLVLVLEDGRLTQFGAPADLLTEKGLFRRVYEQQTRESADQATV